jgi:hypothetical protein
MDNNSAQEILREIGNMKSEMQKGFGGLQTQCSVLDTKLEALSGPNGRVTALENEQKTAKMWRNITSVAIPSDQ